jgi:CheY-like chemotaxis protein
LRQILTNLLDNAIKFTHHGSVTLRLRALDPAGNSHVSLAQTHKNQLSLISDGQPHPTATVQVLYFEVADTGVGIAANELPTIFDAFVQSESGRESLHGTGLGLAISRRFVQLLGGDITATSQLGQGTTFRFSISVRSAEVTSVRASHASRRVIGLVQDQPTYRVLVADDADAHRQLLVQWLSTVGFEVRPASNGQAAIEQWREFAPHLIWMDMRMPVMDGFEAVRLIRMQELSARTAAAIDRNPEQPIPGSEAPDLARSRPTTIIAITAAVFEEEQQDILTVGCDDIVVKPCSESVIFEKIAHHLGVTYLYEEPVDAGCEDNGADTPGADRAAPLLAAIQSMPSEWRLRVNYAARRANEPEIFQLLEDIPPAQIELKTAIVNLMQQFQLDQLIQWTQLPGGAADSPETDRDDNSDPNSPPLFDHDDS